MKWDLCTLQGTVHVRVPTKIPKDLAEVSFKKSTSNTKNLR